MSLYVDEMYIGMMGQRLPLFSQSGPRLWNFRCPICGDSQTDPYKKRGYFYVDKSQESYNYICHNCSASHKLYRFIEYVFPDLLRNYRLEKFVGSGKKSQFEMEKAIPSSPKPTLIEEPEPVEVVEKETESEDVDSDCFPIYYLEDGHPALRYLLEERKLPEELMERFFFAPEYVHWVEKITHKERALPEHSRIVIPYVRNDGVEYRYVARAYEGDDFGKKYLYTEMYEGSRFYNFYQIDPKKFVYVVEGQIDALLLGNSIAVGNAKYSKGEFKALEDYVIVPDNQPRNRDVVESIQKAISSGHPVCIWPSKIVAKDINDLWKTGMSQDSIQNLIRENTSSGIRAQIALNRWKRV